VRTVRDNTPRTTPTEIDYSGYRGHASRITISGETCYLTVGARFRLGLSYRYHELAESGVFVMSSNNRQLWCSWATVALLNALGVATPISLRIAPTVVAYLFIPFTLWLVIGIPLQLALTYFIIGYARESTGGPLYVGAPEPVPLSRSEKNRIRTAAAITGVETILGIVYFVWLSNIRFG